jgi:hypothetical protein
MHVRWLKMAAILAAATAASAGSFSTDFESYALGPIAGQDGWVLDNSGAGAVDPVIAADPTGGGHGKVLQIDPNDFNVAGGWSGAFRGVGDLIAEGVNTFSVSWDQWRTGLGDNLWFAEDISFGGWWGLEWDGSQHIHAISNFGAPEAALTAQVWQSVRLDFDATAGTVTGYLDGVSFGAATAQTFATFRGIDLEVEGSAAGGGLNGSNYIDNVVVTPEPAGVLLLAVAAALLRRR